MTRVTRYTRLFQLRNNTYPLCRFSKVYVLSLAKGNLETRVTHVTRATVYSLAAIYLTTPRRLYKRAIPAVDGHSLRAAYFHLPPAPDPPPAAFSADLSGFLRRLTQRKFVLPRRPCAVCWMSLAAHCRDFTGSVGAVALAYLLGCRSRPPPQIGHRPPRPRAGGLALALG